MNTHEWPRCIKSARQKRRLVKTDRDKQLIQLYKRRDELSEQKRLLPMVPLEHPYQRGWKRFFVLRDDIKRSLKAEFYEALLTKINTVEYHHDKSFKRKKRRNGRNVYVVKQQQLQEFYEYSWQANRMKLTDDEQACFTCVTVMDIKRRTFDIKYVITEPWRYVLKIAPRMVTHIKLMDVDIEKELACIDNRIDNNHLTPRMHRLTNGRHFRYRHDFDEPAKYINKFKNIPRYACKEVYLDLEA
jgi:hypothetical protein